MSTAIPENRFVCDAFTLAAATGGTVVRHLPQDKKAIGVVTDSRSVKTNCVYLALKGDTHDGHAFLSQAEVRGACMVVVERGRGVEAEASLRSVGIVEVDDTLLAFGRLARTHLHSWRRAMPVARTVAITGSAGKTTTKEVCAAILGSIGVTHRSAGNLNNRVGVPAVALALDELSRFCVFEAGMNRPGEIAALAAIIEPDVSILTNVGVAHVGGLAGSALIRAGRDPREAVAQEKGALLTGTRRSGAVVVNADDPFALSAAGLDSALGSGSGGFGGPARARAITFGRASGATYRLVAREPNGNGSRIVFTRSPHSARSPEHIDVTVPGEAFAMNVLAALAAADAASTLAGGEILGCDRVSAAIANLRVEGRLALVPLANGALLVDDTYNANPASFAASLATLGEVAGGRRRVAVVGEMKELGELASTAHKELGRALANAGVTLAIGCGGALVNLALTEARTRGVGVVIADDVNDAAREAVSRIVARDVVLVKGSRSVGAEFIVNALATHFGVGER